MKFAAFPTAHFEEIMSSKTLEKWPFASSEVLKDEFDLDHKYRYALTNRLPTPLYWARPPGGRKLLWNIRLIRHLNHRWGGRISYPTD